MPRSSTSLTTSSLFMKRRRAYVACGNCRRRKIKCVTPSEVEYKPCTRCSQKGLKCEYFPGLGDEPSLESLTPCSGNHLSFHYLDKSCSPPPPITSPSADIGEYLDTSSHSTPLSAAPPTAALDCPWTLELTPQHLGTNPYSPAMQQLASGAVAQYPRSQYPRSATPSVGSPNMHSGSPYSQQQYAPQASGIDSWWLLPIPHFSVYVFAHRDPAAAGRVTMQIEDCGRCYFSLFARRESNPKLP
ncbi:hypothetical protein C8R45DRAFT_1135174 [Mycena sanguinolenta]|nr:hypothetical protein C8R45DRAFT_1135174 [Mycena sanguinolenta]